VKLKHVFWMAVFSLLLVGAYPVLAQEGCPTEAACPEIALTPATLLGDFVVNDQVLAAGQNRVVLQVPAGQSVQIVVRNIQSPGEAGFNDLFVYGEATTTVNLRAGQTRLYTLSPRKQFVRGTLAHTCQPRNRQEGEDVSCQIIIDGVDRGIVPINEAAQFTLDPGEHLVRVQLVGGAVGLWEPNVKEQNTRITAGRTTNLRTQFDKRARLIATFADPSLIADFYLNDQLLATQVASIDQWLAPNQNYTVRVSNVAAMGGSGLYQWAEARSTTYLSPGQERTLQLRPTRQEIPLPDASMEQTAVALLNEARVNNGLNPLNINPTLTATAQAYSDVMAANNWFEHIGPDGSQPWDRALAMGYPSSFVGENILVASFKVSGRTAHNMWWSSPPHQENMLFPDYTEIGVACSTSRSTSGLYYCTMNLGRP